MSDETLHKRYTPDEQAARIRELAALGWKVRDIASLLGAHPEIIKRELDRDEAA